MKHTPRLLSTVACALLMQAVHAQHVHDKPPTQAELKARLEQKLQADFLKKAQWITDYEKALAAAAADGKLIFGYFTRSYSR